MSTPTQTATPGSDTKEPTPLSPRDQKLLEAICQGATYAVAAERSGHSPRTVTRRMADSGFKARVREALAESVKQVDRRITASTVVAVQVLTGIAGNAEVRGVRQAERGQTTRNQIAAATPLLNAFVRLHGRTGPEEGDLTPEQIIDHILVGVSIDRDLR